MKEYKLSVFNNLAKEKFANLSEEERLSAYNKVMNMPDSVDIRNREDTMISIALLNRGLNVFDKNKVDPFKQFLSDWNLIPEEYKIKDISVFDTETTDKYNAYCVSIAVVNINLLKKEIENRFYSLVNPKDKINLEATEIHKISIEDVINEKTFDELYYEIKSLFDNSEMVVGHNVDFDLKVIERECNRINKENFLLNKSVFDTMFMTKDIVKAIDVKGKIKNPKLEESMQYFNLKQPDGEYHNALVDTEACANLFLKLFE